MMAVLYDVDVRTISYHLKNVFADHELEENSDIQFFRYLPPTAKPTSPGTTTSLASSPSATR
jgi:hypothetical protein